MDKLVFKLLNHCVVTAETKACLQCPRVFFSICDGNCQTEIDHGLQGLRWDIVHWEG